ncbi:MAG: hypothetical protein ACX94D_16850 [Henriciella sp.]
MSSGKLSDTDIEYVADMLRAILWVKDDLAGVSDEALTDLKSTLKAAEVALRRVSAELGEIDHAPDDLH